MRKILVTGANSYIGMSFEKWLEQYKGQYSVDTLDLKDRTWKECDFGDYDSIFHVAGIAHVTSDPKMEDLYYKVNRDLAIETAHKAKNDGTRQFIFMSSIIVYGDSSRMGKKMVIKKDSIPNPTNFYGDSKLQAERGLEKLADESFKIVILRPPMIYGKGSKGNYQKLARLALKIPFFPDVENQRSMLYIDNLCEHLRLMIDNEEQGLFFLQNKDYVKTSEMVRLIAEAHGKRMRLIKILNPGVYFLSYFVGMLNKVFGNLVYDRELTTYKENYQVRDFGESIRLTEDVSL
jgi:UDP-glucose 4-epimerase